MNEPMEAIVGGPSLEATQSDTLANIKAFLARLWTAIKKAAATVWDFIRKVLKKLTEAEKQLYLNTQSLLRQVGELDSHVTRKPAVANTLAMRWAFPTGAGLPDSATLLHHVKRYRQVHAVIHGDLTERLKKTIDTVREAVLKISDPNDTQAIQEAVLQAKVGMRFMAPKQVQALFRNYLETVNDHPVVQLTYDRRLRVEGDNLPEPHDPEFLSALRHLTLRIEQFEIQDAETDLGEMQAMHPDQIETILKELRGLLDGGTRSDSQRRFQSLYLKAKGLEEEVSGALDSVNEETKHAFREIIGLAQLVARWSSIPYGQLDTITVHFARSVLHVCKAHIDNYSEELVEARSHKLGPAPKV